MGKQPKRKSPERVGAVLVFRKGMSEAEVRQLLQNHLLGSVEPGVYIDSNAACAGGALVETFDPEHGCPVF